MTNNLTFAQWWLSWGWKWVAVLGFCLAAAAVTVWDVRREARKKAERDAQWLRRQ